MQISIVTVCYNAEAFIEGTVASVARQCHPDYEHIIVDGASKDGTCRVVKSLRHERLRLVSEPDSGVYDAMNKGLKLFEGDAVGFLNADDRFHDERVLSTFASALDDADIVYGDLICVDAEDRVVRVWTAGDYPKNGFHNGWVPPHPTFYVRRHVVEKIAGFNLNYSVASDYDFMLRASALPNIRIRRIPRILVDYRLGGISSGSLKNIVKGNLECLDSRRRNLGHGFVDMAMVSRPLRRIPQFFRSFASRDSKK